MDQPFAAGLPSRPPVTAAGRSRLDAKHLDHLLSQALGVAVSPGLAVALSLDGARLESFAGLATAGEQIPMSSRSRFQLGCLTKLLTSLVVLELSAQNRVDLDEPVSSYVPDLPVLVGQVTARQLLAHLGGYQGPDFADATVRHGYSWPRFTDAMRVAKRLFRAGTVFNYEHTEYVLLGELAQWTTGQPMHALFQTMIFEPLQISCGDLHSDHGDAACHTSDHVISPGTHAHRAVRAIPYSPFWMPSLSNLTMTVADLVTLGEAVAGFGTPPFSTATVQALRSTQVRLPPVLGGAHQERLPVAFGAGCAQYGQSVFGHNGSARGQTCALRFDLSTRTVVVVALNAWNPYARDSLCDKLVRVTSGSPPPEPSDPMGHWNFGELAGRYIGTGNTHVEATADAGSLECRIHVGGRRFGSVMVRHGRSGALDAISDPSHLSVGFFVPPGGDEPALMVGLNAFRRDNLNSSEASV